MASPAISKAGSLDLQNVLAADQGFQMQTALASPQSACTSSLSGGEWRGGLVALVLRIVRGDGQSPLLLKQHQILTKPARERL